MNPYTPLPGDQLRKGETTLHIERVFPEQVALYFTVQGGPAHNHVVIPRDDFDRRAQASFRQGATLIRDGVTLWPLDTGFFDSDKQKIIDAFEI